MNLFTAYILAHKTEVLFYLSVTLSIYFFLFHMHNSQQLEKEPGSRENDGENNSFFVVLLMVGKMIVVKKNWIERMNTTQTRIFYSPNNDDHPIFNEPLYYFKENSTSCYLGHICKKFGNFVFFFIKIVPC